MYEKEMQELLKQAPEKLLREEGLRFIDAEIPTAGKRLDLVFEDRFGRHVLVECQRGALDTRHTDRHIEFLRGYQQSFPNISVRLVYVAEIIAPHQKDFLQRRGYEFHEISERTYLKVKSDLAELNKPEFIKSKTTKSRAAEQKHSSLKTDSNAQSPSKVQANYYTQYWSKEWLNDEEVMKGEPLKHTAGDLFGERWGVTQNDFVYIVTVSEGNLYLIGRMEVDKICPYEEARKLLETSNLWDAKYHLIVKSGTEMPMRSDNRVPLSVTKRLKFLSPTGQIKKLKFASDTKLDRQTLRGVRKLTQKSAVELNKLLEN